MHFTKDGRDTTSGSSVWPSVDFPHQAAFEASSQVVVNLGMSGKHSKDTWVMAVLEIPHSQSTAVPSVTYKLLVASWHQRKGTFLEHFFGAGSTDAVCHLVPGRCPFCPGQRAFNGAAALSQASWLLPADWMVALILVSLMDLTSAGESPVTPWVHWLSLSQGQLLTLSWAVLTSNTAWRVWLDNEPRQCLCQHVLHNLGRT